MKKIEILALLSHGISHINADIGTSTSLLPLTISCTYWYYSHPLKYLIPILILFSSSQYRIILTQYTSTR